MTDLADRVTLGWGVFMDGHNSLFHDPFCRLSLNTVSRVS